MGTDIMQVPGGIGEVANTPKQGDVGALLDVGVLVEVGEEVEEDVPKP